MESVPPEQINIIPCQNCSRRIAENLVLRSILPEDYSTIERSEPDLSPSDSELPCADLGFTLFLESEVHSAGPIAQAADMYTLPPSTEAQTTKEISNEIL
jgi:hypothetical protein